MKQRISTEYIVELIKDLFDINCHFRLAGSSDVIPSPGQLFRREQFLEQRELARIFQRLNTGDICVITDCLFASWIAVPTCDQELLIGPFNSFPKSVPVMYNALAEIGCPSGSMSDFRNYQNSLPVIIPDYLGRIFKFLTKTVTGSDSPNVQWISLFHKELLSIEEDNSYKPAAELLFEEGTEFMAAVYTGNAHAATEVLSRLQRRVSSQPDRFYMVNEESLHNQTIICTLMRVAAYQAGVMPAIIEEIIHKYRSRFLQAGSPEERQKLTFKITANLCEQVQHVKKGTGSPLVQKAICYITEHYTQLLSQKEVAEMLGVHPNYLSALFSRETGMTFTQYMTNLRLEAAAFKLRMSSMPIHEIADSVGLPDHNYFSRVFRNKYHMTPTQYRGKERV